MKKLLLILAILVPLSGCSTDVVEDFQEYREHEEEFEEYRAEKKKKADIEARKSAMERARFIFKPNPFEGFQKIECDGNERMIMHDTKKEIARQKHLDVYSKVLTMEYLDLASYEYHEMGDKLDGQYFFYKAIKASRGAYPLPEHLDDWRIPRKNFEDLKWTREDMMEMMYDDGLLEDPMNLAKAQVAFDCWIEQQSEGLNELDVRICRKEAKDRLATSVDTTRGELSEADIERLLEEFGNDRNGRYINKDELRDIYMPKDEIAEEMISFDEEMEIFFEELEVLDEECEDEPLTLESNGDSDMEITKVEDTKYNVYFNWNYTVPKEGDKEKIRQVVEDFLSNGYTTIVLKAYTDRSGTAAINQVFSDKRGTTVRDLLVEEGIEEKIIALFSFGESMTPGPDGERNADYRKVEIIFE